MIKANSILAVLIAFSSTALAQDNAPYAPWETELSGEAVIVLSPGDTNDTEDDGQIVTYEVGMSAKAERVLANGAIIGARGTFRVQQDHPSRAGFTGRTVPPSVAGPDLLGLRGGFSGLTTGGEPEDAGARAQLERAYIYIDGGYGEGVIGRDAGVASRLHEGAPSVFSHARADSPLLDPSGLNIVNTRHDITGPAAKISYTTPRIVGVKAGVSYTPQSDIRGLDRDPARAVAGVLKPEIENVVEVTVNATRKFRSSGTRVRVAAAYSTADVKAPVTPPAVQPYARMETWSAGGEVSLENVTFGASVLKSNNGVQARAGDYTAWSVGAKTEAFGWDWSATYGEATDDLTGADGSALNLGAARDIASNLRVAAGYQYVKRDDTPIFGIDSGTQIAEFAGNDRESGRAVIEITLSF